MPCQRRCVSEHLEEPERFHGRRLPLQRQWLDGLDPNGVAHERSRLGSDERLARHGRLLEPRRDVDGVAGDERLRLTADHDLASVDADACLETVLQDSGLHLRGGTNGTERIVLVRDGNPEDGHDRVSDELLDRASMPPENDAKFLEVAAHARTQRLGIGRLAERGRANEVAEEDGDDLALLASGLRRR